MGEGVKMDGMREVRLPRGVVRVAIGQSYAAVTWCSHWRLDSGVLYSHCFLNERWNITEVLEIARNYSVFFRVMWILFSGSVIQLFT